MEFKHIPVLLSEAVDSLNIKPDGIYIDGTAGGGGHSLEIAKRLTTGRLICLDKDPDAVAAASMRLSGFKNARVFLSDFSDIDKIAFGFSLDSVNGILLDLGVSSFQLDNPHRGFSYGADCMLDMRMSSSGMSAADVVNTYDEAELARVLWEYSEEKYSRQIARLIVQRRQTEKILTSRQLSEIVRQAVPAYSQREKNPLKRTFQALRIEVNGEILRLPAAFRNCLRLISSGGRLSIISFHSLEDKEVKRFFSEMSRGCDCSREYPVCICGKKPQAKIITKKPIAASEEELASNKRAKSAHLRVLEKL